MPSDDELLDNPAYAALSGPDAPFAQRTGRALRYRPDVAPFMALPPDAMPADWRDAAALIGPGGGAGLVHDGAPLPDGWTAIRGLRVVQMAGENTAGAEDDEATPLGLADVPDVLALVEATNPGPFLPCTIELGGYLGIRRDGELIAMAGERMHLPGWTEVSAVCTSPEHRGQGLASRLTSAVVAGIRRRSARPFLHALPSNAGAIRLYETLGFRLRRELTITVAAPAE
jgi:ribosomal protein S18 acetylase RimI-like enzyme